MSENKYVISEDLLHTLINHLSNSKEVKLLAALRDLPTEEESEKDPIREEVQK